VWRQGVKHDLTNVMVLEKNSSTNLTKDSYQNGLKECINLEKTFIYPFLKSSQLKNGVISDIKLKVIIPQQHIGQSTEDIQQTSPKLWEYLNSHRDLFNNRKSKIYRKAPPFSIFGIGPYSFQLYKIGISGFYKDIRFTLILPFDQKPVMLDDTCYFLSFDTLSFAVIVWTLLNLPEVKEFLNSIIFSDEKRPVTKDILMRLNLLYLINNIEFSEIHDSFGELLKAIGQNGSNSSLDFDLNQFISFKTSIMEIK
jgi:hypothetical protein